jgi:hypothetical protein
MTSETLEAYLKRLDRELALRGIWSSRVIEEAREHLIDATRMDFGADWHST